jgi:hypothetical protein
MIILSCLMTSFPVKYNMTPMFSTVTTPMAPRRLKEYTLESDSGIGYWNKKDIKKAPRITISLQMFNKFATGRLKGRTKAIHKMITRVFKTQSTS